MRSSSTPFEFRKSEDGIWQRRRVGRGNPWQTLHLEPETVSKRVGSRNQDVMTKRWVWR